MQIYGIFTEYPWKIMENMRKIIPFLSISFLNLLPDDPFSRSFPVVFGRFFGHFWRKSENFGEKWRISGKSFRFLSFSFLFFPRHYTSIPQYPVFMLYNMFIVDTLSERLNV